MTYLSRLRGLAEKARDVGEWAWGPTHRDEEDRVYVPQGATLGNTLIQLGDTYQGSDDHCLYIAALSPARVIALVTFVEATLEREAAEKAYREASGEVRDLCDGPSAEEAAADPEIAVARLRASGAGVRVMHAGSAYRKARAALAALDEMEGRDVGE